MRMFPVEIRKGAFPLYNKASVKIGNLSVDLSSSERKSVDLEEEGNYEVEVYTHWISCKKKLRLDKTHNTIFIDFALPNWYFFAGAFILIPLNILALVGIILPVFSTVPVLIFFLPMMYFTFIRPGKYFKITSKDVAN